jgi:hypothetical protein
MSTHPSTWKRRERQSARLFGAKRQPLSGSSGRDDRTRSDSTHERIYLETKLRASWSVRSLFDRTQILARKEKKIPVLALSTKRRAGCLLVVDSVDLPALVAAYADAGPSGAGSKRGKGPDLSRSGMEPRCDRPGRSATTETVGSSEGALGASTRADEVLGGDRPKEGSGRKRPEKKAGSR